MRGSRVAVLLALSATVLALATACDGGGGAGITTTEIKLGSYRHLPAPIWTGEAVYFHYVNDELGGVCGRKIVYKVEDDGSTPSQTVVAVRRLLRDERVFAIFGGVGTATSAAVYQDLNDKGIPDMYIASGSNLFVEDPQAYRYVFGGVPSYRSLEGPVMGVFIAENFTGAKVGFFIHDDDFGQEIADGVTEGLAGQNEIVDIQTYSTSGPDIRQQITNLRDSGADVVAMAAIPEFAASFIQQARGQDWDVPIVANSAVADPMVFDIAGTDSVVDVWMPTYLILPNQTDVPGVQEYLRVVETYAPDLHLHGDTTFYLYGYAVAQLMTETLRRACDNLTRDGLVEAAESITGWDQPVAWGPVSMSPTDHAPWETFRWVKAEKGEWVPFGAIVSKEPRR